jgi:phosphatidylglycerophosphatase A
MKTDAEKKPPQPPAALILTTPEHLLAFGVGAGLAPRAPGTFGTLIALPFWLLLALLPPAAYAVAVGALFVFGCWLCGESARLLGVHDHPGIVFDEIVGFLVACAPLLALPLTEQPLWLLAAFVLFRLFDILKPWPIGALDRGLQGGLGIMLDDLLAGIFTAALLYGGIHWLH